MAAGAPSVSKFRSLGDVALVAGAVYHRNLYIPSLGRKVMTASPLYVTGFICSWYHCKLIQCFSPARTQLGKVVKSNGFYSSCCETFVSSRIDSLHTFDFRQRQFSSTTGIKFGTKPLERTGSRVSEKRVVKRRSTRSHGSKASSTGKFQQKEKLSTRSTSVGSPLRRTGGNSSGQKQIGTSSTKRMKSNLARINLTQINQKAVRNQDRKDEILDSKDSVQVSLDEKQKKGKRVMRLDPKDKTSKRLFDGYPLPGEEALQEESEESLDNSGLSKNAQFRTIQPAPKLLLHIERHMLGRRRLSEWQKAGYDVKIAPAPLDNVPFMKKNERQPIQEEVFRYKLRFAAAAKISPSFPPVDLPEVAFAGRSNVGKSSLINALTRQWGVARTSDKPGLTQTINFFRLGGRICLVDLPGYGFAYAKEEKKEAWEELVKEFVSTRVGLKRVCILIDAKWGLKPRDEELIAVMESAGTRYQIVLTKSDTIFPMDLARRVTQIQEVFKDNKSLVLPLMMVSSKTGEGLELLRANLAKLAKPSLI